MYESSIFILSSISTYGLFFGHSLRIPEAAWPTLAGIANRRSPACLTSPSGSGASGWQPSCCWRRAVPHRPRTSPTGRFARLPRLRPAPAPTSWRARSRKPCPGTWGNPWWWTTSPAPAASWPPSRRRATRRTVSAFMLRSGGIYNINQTIYSQLPHDPIKEFAPLSIAVRMPIVVVVHPSLPVKSVPELLAYAHAHPGKLSYGSSGVGTSQHLAGELFKSMTKASILHIPYRGGGPAMNDLLANQIGLMFVQLPSALPQIQAGKVRAIAIGSEQRDPKLPAVPTVSESGLKGYNSDTWYGFVMPTGAPPAIVQTLYQAIIAALKEKAQRLSGHGFNVDGGNPQQMADTIATEAKKWALVIKAADIRAD